MKLIYLFTYIFAVLVAVFCVQNTVLATGNALGISPPFQQVTIKNDQPTTVVSVAYKNSTDKPVELKLSVIDFGSLGESGGVAFIGQEAKSNNYKYGLASWMQLESKSVVLLPAESKKITVNIENKDSLSPGGHYGAVVATIVGNGGTVGNPNVSFSQSLSSLIFAKKTGGEKYSLVLSSINSNSKLYKLPTETELRFQNAGNTHVIPRGVSYVYNPLGNLVGKGVVNIDSTIILPESFRTISLPVKYSAKIWMPGRYREKILYRYEGSDKFVEKSIYFFVIPILPIIAFLVIAFLLWKVLVNITKKLRQHFRKYKNSNSPQL